jgi:hypothetical protein
MNRNKSYLFFVVYSILFMCVLFLIQVRSYGMNDERNKDYIRITHSIIDEIDFDTYILYISNFYEVNKIYIVEVMLFQFIKPKGLNNQQLSIDYAVVYDDNIHYGTLFIEVKSIFSFAYTNHGKMILAMSTIVLFSMVEVIKRKIKKR